MTMPVETLAVHDLSDEDWHESCRLWDAVWPKEGRTLEALVASRRTAAATAGALMREHQVHLIRAGSEVVAVARSFVRAVKVGDCTIDVLALASVCTQPSCRGQGLGRAVTLAAFARIGQVADVSLFQTTVPTFYERMGSRRIDAPTVNSLNAEAAFWNPHSMIHPGDWAWPSGTIDLQGPGW